jgi:hypothetical protein
VKIRYAVPLVVIIWHSAISTVDLILGFKNRCSRSARKSFEKMASVELLQNNHFRSIAAAMNFIGGP